MQYLLSLLFLSLCLLPLSCSKQEPKSPAPKLPTFPPPASFEQKFTPAEARAILGEAKAHTPPARFTQNPPHVLFILIDDLNDYPLEAKPLSPMPTLQQFFERSHLFPQTYAPVAACNPSRAALLSGLSPQRSGSVDNKDQLADADLLRHSLFLPEAFQKAGYNTFSVGKIFHGKGLRPTPERFRAMWDEEEYRLGKTVLPEKLPQMPPALAQKKIRWGSVPAAEFFHRDEQIAQAAVNFLARDHQEPFFCAVGFTIPHLPWFVPEELLAQVPEDVAIPAYPAQAFEALPKLSQKNTQKPTPWTPFAEAGMDTEILRHYLASCALLDSLLEQVFTQLEASGLRESTLVVLASDHGYHLGENNCFSKFHLFEHSLRVPMAIALPAQTQGQVHEQPSSLLDLYPTLAELCGLSVPHNQLDGRSLSEKLLGHQDPESAQLILKPEPQPVLSWHEDGVSLRLPSWRYTLWKDGGQELYSHMADPLEHENLLTPEVQAKDPELERIRSELHSLLQVQLQQLTQKNQPNAATESK